MSRNFSNASKPEDLEWRKLRHYKGDKSSFYIKHDTFITPSSKLSIDKPSYTKTNKDKDEAADKLQESMRQLLDGESPNKKAVITQKEETKASKFKRRNSKKVSPKKHKTINGKKEKEDLEETGWMILKTGLE